MFQTLNIDADYISKCVQDSFYEPGNYQSDNRFFKEDRYWMRIMDIREHPTISINNHTYVGDFTGIDVAKAICASFKDRPEYCSSLETLRG